MPKETEGKLKMKSIKEIFRSYAVLNAEGRHINGSDRESNHHYGDAYEYLFSRICDWTSDNKTRCCVECESDTSHARSCSRSGRSSTRLMLEIGNATGESLLAWQEIFQNAEIVGMDIHASTKAVGERIEFHLGDQRLQEDCEGVAAGREFDFIVDDASHQPADVLVSLFWLWSYVRAGGLYVVEDFPSHLVPRLVALWPKAQVIGTNGPFGGVEPLVVFRKPRA